MAYVVADAFVPVPRHVPSPAAVSPSVRTVAVGGRCAPSTSPDARPLLSLLQHAAAPVMIGSCVLCLQAKRSKGSARSLGSRSRGIVAVQADSEDMRSFLMGGSPPSSSSSSQTPQGSGVAEAVDARPTAAAGSPRALEAGREQSQTGAPPVQPRSFWEEQQQLAALDEEVGQELPPVQPRSFLEEQQQLAALDEEAPGGDALLSRLETYFRTEVKMSRTEFRRLEKCWRFSGDRIPDEVICKDIVSFLMGPDVGLQVHQVSRAISMAPTVLYIPSIETLREKTAFLASEAMFPPEQIAELIHKLPDILETKYENLERAKEFWTEQAGVSESDFGRTLLKDPRGVMTKTNALQGKWMFASDVMGLSLEEVFDIEPSFFRMSLDKVVAPKHFFAVYKDNPLPRGKALSEALKCDNSKFHTLVGADEGEYQAWLENDWPGSEEARTVAWIMPRRGSGSSSSGRRSRPAGSRLGGRGRYGGSGRYRQQRGGYRQERNSYGRRQRHDPDDQPWRAEGRINPSGNSWEWAAPREKKGRRDDDFGDDYDDGAEDYGFGDEYDDAESPPPRRFRRPSSRDRGREPRQQRSRRDDFYDDDAETDYGPGDEYGNAESPPPRRFQRPTSRDRGREPRQQRSRRDDFYDDDAETDYGPGDEYGNAESPPPRRFQRPTSRDRGREPRQQRSRRDDFYDDDAETDFSSGDEHDDDESPPRRRFQKPSKREQHRENRLIVSSAKPDNAGQKWGLNEQAPVW